MSANHKYWFLLMLSAFMCVVAAGDKTGTGSICATLFFCAAMIVDEIGKMR